MVLPVGAGAALKLMSEAIGNEAVPQLLRGGFATCALANKLARIAWATWRYGRDFDPNHAAVAA